MPYVLTKKIADQIATRVDQLFYEKPESYDRKHIMRVERQCAALADERGLDINISRSIGLLHDHGWVIAGVIGEGHSAEGAEIAREWLNDYDIDDETLDIICNAIRNHNQKKAFHDRYSELVKDADSLAHQEECPDKVPKYEAYRAQDAHSGKLTLTINATKDLNAIFAKHLKCLNKSINKGLKKGFSDSAVHKIRIRIRKLRALLWIDKDKQWKKKAQFLNKNLKGAFSVFAYPRELTVFYKMVENIDLEAVQLQLVEAEIKKSKKDMPKKLLKWQKKIKKSKLPNLHAKEPILESRLQTYRDMLAYSYEHMDDVLKLHQLRIFGKKFKYLMEEDILIGSDRIMYELIRSLHQKIGDLNDIFGNRKFIKKFLPDHGASLEFQVQSYKRIFQTRQEKLTKEIKALIFRLLIRLNTCC